MNEIPEATWVEEMMETWGREQDFPVFLGSEVMVLICDACEENSWVMKVVC